MQYWLIKSEPGTYSIDDLRRDKQTAWEGVRNYQARNHMRSMKKGDLLLFYHSSADPTCIAGIAKVVSGPHADDSQFKKSSEYFEPRASHENPVWECVDVEFVEKAKHPLDLDEVRKDPALAGMVLLQRGSRLSVQPVSAEHFAHIRTLLSK
jgi:predicted RNA-binding protein with PUA-like domain